jgi:hypothetical protein
VPDRANLCGIRLVRAPIVRQPWGCPLKDTPPFQASQLSASDFVNFVRSLATQSSAVGAAFAAAHEASGSASPSKRAASESVDRLAKTARTGADGAGGPAGPPSQESASHAVAAQALMDLMATSADKKSVLPSLQNMLNPSPGSIALLGGGGVAGHASTAASKGGAAGHARAAPGERPSIRTGSPAAAGEEAAPIAGGAPMSPSMSSSASTLRCGSSGAEDSAARSSESPSVEAQGPAAGAAATTQASGGGGEDGSAHNKYCHFCQHIKVKRASSMLACENRGCNRRFCEHCLQTHLGDTGAGAPGWHAANGGTPWHCPICAKTCCCTQRDCGKQHRHCKAYRYRRKRALLAENDKTPDQVEDGRSGSHGHQARLVAQALPAIATFSQAPMPFGMLGPGMLHPVGPYGPLGSMGGPVGPMAQLGVGAPSFGAMSMQQMGQLAQMQALIHQQAALQQRLG